MEKKKSIDIRKLLGDIGIDILGGILITLGVYNFASAAEFPMVGISGIALIFYYLFKWPIGVVSMVLNVPIALVCYRTLGKKFFARSVKTIVITSLIMDKIGPMIPLYTGNRLLAALCTGVLSGLGYAIIYMRNSSTGGTDFIMMTVKAKKPHLSLGRIAFFIDVAVIAAGAFIYKEVDGVILGIIVTFLLAKVVDKVMYGIDAGKLALIVTQHGAEVAEAIDKISGRGSTFLHAEGSFSREQQQVVMCACNNKEMYNIEQKAKSVDPTAFIIIVESNEVLGAGFKEEL